MRKPKPQVLKENGREVFVVLPYEEFQSLQQRLADAEDLLALRRARRSDDPRRPGLSAAALKAGLARPRKGVRRQRSARKGNGS